MTCLHCGNVDTTNGLALCEACRAAASVYLEFLPVYFRNIARWRPGRAGARPVPGSREPRGTATESADRVSRALDEAGADVMGWARCLADDRGVSLPDGDGEAATTIALCRILLENLTSVATLEWAGEFVRSVGEHELKLRRLTETVAPGWYAGECGRCEAPTYVVPGLTWVTCGGCGATTYARDHLETILSEARGWVASPVRLAEVLVALLDSETSVEDLRKRIAIWGARDRLSVVRPTEYAQKKYRMGEVLDRLAGPVAA